MKQWGKALRGPWLPAIDQAIDFFKKGWPAAFSLELATKIMRLDRPCELRQFLRSLKNGVSRARFGPQALGGQVLRAGNQSN